MELKVSKHVISAQRLKNNATLNLTSSAAIGDIPASLTEHCYAYPPFINSHDHLVGNWYPRAGESNPYPNTDIWVEEMKYSPSYLERNRVWKNDGSFQLLRGTAYRLFTMGCYKNIFSGCIAVQDHGPNQESAYYDAFPINVIRDYRQCHSMSLGNWWGGNTAIEEMAASQGKEPFIVHLGEGTDTKSDLCFSKFVEQGLDQPNSLIIHGIALTEEEIAHCGKTGVSICICPESNMFLIGKTINVEACRTHGVNLVIGTDSTMSGSTNILTEIRRFKELFPQVPDAEIFDMITSKARRAMMLDSSYGTLPAETSHLLLMAPRRADPYQNLQCSDMHDIELLVYNGTPIYGNAAFLNHFEHNAADYFFFNHHHQQRFVIGHPEAITAEIDAALGYHKALPYLPY